MRGHVYFAGEPTLRELVFGIRQRHIDIEERINS